MSGPLVLSLFPGIGLQDMAFEEEGICIVRGPDLLWGGRIEKFHPPAGRFDGVIGGPPCQRYSSLAHLIRATHGEDALAPDLIPEYARVVSEAAPAWFLMENVIGAPLPTVDGYGITDQVIVDAWVGGLTSRRRRFSFGLRQMANLSARLMFQVETLALYPTEMLPAVCGGDRETPVAIGGSGKRLSPHWGPRLPLAEMLRRQGASLTLLDGAAFTMTAKRQMVGNGVPLPMGRAIARAVRKALDR